MQKSMFRQMVERILREAKIYQCLPDEDLINTWGISPTDTIRVINNPTVEQYKTIQKKLGVVRGLADAENFYIPMDNEMIHIMILELIEKNKLPLSKHYFDIRDDGKSLYVLTDQNVKFNSKPVETVFKQLGREADIRLAKKYVEALANLNHDLRLHFKDIETLHEFYNWIDSITKIDGFIINLNDLIIDNENLTIYKKRYKPRGEYFVESNLQEAKQIGTLYHATDFNGLAAILGTNKMMANWSQGISFTRNKYYFYGDFPYQLVFDGNKLSEHYKVYPFNFQYFGYNNASGFEGNYQTKHPDDNLEAEVCVVSKGRKYPDYYTDLKKPFFGTYGDEYNKNWNEILNIKSYIIGLLINHAFTTENEARYAERLFREHFKSLPVEHLNMQNTSFKKMRAKHDKAREEYFSNLITFDDIQKEIFKDKGWTDWDEWGKLTPDERGELIKEYEQILSKKYPNKKLASKVDR